ncbi:MAG: hypothetical protein IT168_07180 [Bryobacterales bacterium]|nr:hypothetical protein [Bryobacterales bacterium]
MAFSINTNIASLQSQEYLRVNSDFQQKTINRVTSGLRIVSSGDDAAGLAIANSYRSDRAVLSQGVRNANDALSTLQTIDGGLNNISQLLDRARTLAAQSATGTFSGDRSILNDEFQNVIGEIDRQSQVIGLNNAGSGFAQNLSVFIGGGRGSTDAAKITNGSVAVNLSTSTVDAGSLKLKGYQAVGANAMDVDEIVSDNTNIQSLVVSGKTDFFFRGAGFSDDNRIRVSVNLAGVDNADKLTAAINSAIAEAGKGGTDAATAFQNAGVKAKLVSDSNNKTSVVFESSGAAFQVSAGDRMSNALLGNASGNSGNAIDYVVQGGANVSTGNGTATYTDNVVIRVQGGSLTSAVDLTLTGTTATAMLSDLSSQVAHNASLLSAGISLSSAAVGSKLSFTSKRGEDFEVSAVNDFQNMLGLGSAISGSDSFDSTSVTVGGTVGDTGTFYVSVGGGSFQTYQTTGSDVTAVVAELNTWIAGNTTLQRAGLKVTDDGGNIKIESQNGSFLRVTGDAGLGFDSTGTVSTAGASVNTGASYTTSASMVAGGVSASSLLAFDAIRDGGDDQVITLTAKDASGVQQSLAVSLQAENGALHGRTIDEAIGYINDQIQASGSADLKKIVAVKQRDGGEEKIQFISSLSDFKVSVSTNAGTTGVNGTDVQGHVLSSSKVAGGSNIDISSQSNAEGAVSALAKAVSILGNVQAVVGRGQNQFNFAVSLAQTQLNNLAASESRIRDADLAAEAANLTKAQILSQAGIAALAQANSAPQAVLSLLRG